MSFFHSLLEALPVIFSLVLIEGLLSVDNALAIAAMASHLPDPQKKIALRLGIIGAYVFRGIALGLVGWIIANPWIKMAGALYLIYLMCSHLTKAEEHGEGQAGKAAPGLIATVLQIELMDLSLSVDNVIAAAIMSPKLWVVCTGVFIGILTLRFVAGYCIVLMQKFPVLAQTAFLLVGYVGMLLCFEMATERHVTELQKFSGIASILVLSIAYSRSEVMRTLFNPVVKGGRLLMHPVAFAGDAVFWPLRVLHRAVDRVFQNRKRKESGSHGQTGEGLEG